jgi:hypothetical protein
MLANDDLGNLGRLGNQMFQYAALRGLASKHGYEYCLPPREVVATRDPNVINSDITMFECFKIHDAPRYVTNFPKVTESCFQLDQNLWNNCPDNISLYGYFQTEKYFKHIEDEIRSDFSFNLELYENCKEFINSLNSQIISLHIRRGDYLANPNHPVQTLDYYKQALQLLPQELPVLVFSDDYNWCLSQELFDDDKFMISENSSVDSDLCMMSLCDYHIIANSSFSWWGAWLAKSKKIIAPKNWFDGSCLNKDVSDMRFGDWIWV